tara:strand:+ start:7951 stop:9084 length:1134 start_codon:yes stop_codon:yes gene_type:complete
VSVKKITFYDDAYEAIFSIDDISRSKQKLFDSQKDGEETAILISNDFSFYKFDLPQTSQRNLNKVIPFMLGEELLGEIDDYFWVYENNTHLVGAIEHQKIQEIKDSLNPAIKQLIPIQAVSTSIENLLVVLKDKAFISLKNKWFWLADVESIINTLELTLSRYDIENLTVWSSNKKIKLPKINIEIDNKNFSSDKELLKEFSEILDTHDSINFFTKEYEQKINWLNLFSRYKFYTYSTLGFIGIFFASAIIQFSYLSVSNNLLKDKILNTFKEKFPSENLESDLISQVNGLINQGQIDYSALNAVSVISDAVSNSENIVLVSISYEQTRFIIEVQTNSYDQLQEYVDLVNSLGLNVNLGASRRVNNFIQGEISINAF